MSAYLVDPELIGNLVSYFTHSRDFEYTTWLTYHLDLDWKEGTDIERKRIDLLNILLDGNIDSLHARYGGDKETMTDSWISLTRTDYLALANKEARMEGFDWVAGEIIDAVKTYEYQSCEHDEWWTSDACKLANFIYRKAGDTFRINCDPSKMRHSTGMIRLSTLSTLSK